MMLRSLKSVNYFLFSIVLVFFVSPACIAQSSTHQASSVVTDSLKKTASNTPVESLGPMLLGLIGILAIIFLLAGLLKKFTSFNLSSSQIKVLECQRIGAKEKLIVVNVQNKHLLLGVTPQNISHLCDLDNPPESKPSGISFDNLMKQFLGHSSLKSSRATNQSSKINCPSSEDLSSGEA